MTPTEQKIINFISTYFETNKYSPPLSEIMLGLGHKSKGTIHRYLTQLVKQGELVKAKESGRTVYQRPNKHFIPLVGRIAAGRPIEAVSESEQLNFFDRFTDEGLYQLQIKGDSMQDAGMVDGDIVLIKPARRAQNGQIVVALIDGSDVTLKRYYARGKKIELFPENTNHQPQLYEPERVEIQGILHSVHKFEF